MNEDELLMQYKLLQRADEKIDPFAKYYFQQMGEKEFMGWASTKIDKNSFIVIK